MYIYETPETKWKKHKYGIEIELSGKLGINVDLLTEKAISPLIDGIKEDADVIFG